MEAVAERVDTIFNAAALLLNVEIEHREKSKGLVAPELGGRVKLYGT